MLENLIIQLRARENTKNGHDLTSDVVWRSCGIYSGEIVATNRSWIFSVSAARAPRRRILRYQRAQRGSCNILNDTTFFVHATGRQQRDERDKGIARVTWRKFRVELSARAGLIHPCAPRPSPTNKRRGGGFLTATNHSAISSVSADRIFRSPTRARLKYGPAKESHRTGRRFSSSTVTRESFSFTNSRRIERETERESLYLLHRARRFRGISP